MPVWGKTKKLAQTVLVYILEKSNTSEGGTSYSEINEHFRKMEIFAVPVIISHLIKQNLIVKYDGKDEFMPVGIISITYEGRIYLDMGGFTMTRRQKLHNWFEKNNVKAGLAIIGIIGGIIGAIFGFIFYLLKPQQPSLQPGNGVTVDSTKIKKPSVADTIKIINKDRYNPENITFNDFDNDLSTLTTDIFRENRKMNWRININAYIGDIVNFRIYYHNTSKFIALSTKVRLNVFYINHCIYATASITSRNSENIYLGSCVVNVSAEDDITLYQGGVYWYPNQAQTPLSFLNGQTGVELISNTGLNLGTINPGWSTQGSVVCAIQILKKKF